MWRFKLAELLSEPPVFLSMSADHGAYHGRYLHVGAEPFALGRLVGEGAEAQVFELLSLRSGSFSHVIKICKHPQDSRKYRRWAKETRDEINPHSAMPAVEQEPAVVFELPCGGLVKLQRYFAIQPELAWNTYFPASEVIAHQQLGQLWEAESACCCLLDRHGRKGILLDVLAGIYAQQGDLDAARGTYEIAAAAHRADGNSLLLGTLFNLADTLLQLHQNEQLPGTMSTKLADGTVLSQRLAPLGEEFPPDLADIALETVVESLAIEPYFASSLALLCKFLNGGGEGESFGVVANALLMIDPLNHQAADVRQHLDQIEQFGRMRKKHPEDSPPEIPSEVMKHLEAHYANYEPPIPDGCETAESLYHASIYHSRRGDFERAGRDIEQACELDPNTVKYVIERADNFCRSGAWEVALALLTSMVPGFADDWSIYEALGRVQSELKKPREACIAFLKSLACNPPHQAEITARLAIEYCKNGNIEDGWRYAEVAYAADPLDWLVNMYVLQCLKRVAFEHLRHKKCEQFYAAIDRAFKIFEDARVAAIMRAELHFLKAQFFLFQENTDAARRSLKDVLDCEPDHEFAIEVLSSLDAVPD